MIFLAAGTQDAREIARLLLTHNYEVTASVVSDYGKILLSEEPQLTVIEQKLDAAAMHKVLKEKDIKIFVDASHPYAVNISAIAMQVCHQLGIYYIRYERPTVALPDYEKLCEVTSFTEAAEKAAQLGKNIFLTTGSRHLDEFKGLIGAPAYTVTARVLPVIESIEVCTQAGMLPKEIIAMQGPFSKELNEAMYQQKNSDVVIMKNSGRLGGSDTKLAAAIAMKIAVVVISRPKMKYEHLVTDKKELIDKVREVMGK